MSAALHAARLRANPGYQAVPLNRLAPEDRSALVIEPEDYGVLLPRRGNTLAPLAIDCDTALLFLTLQEPGPPPDFLFAQGESRGEQTLHKLLLDQILELDGPDGYVSGAGACALIGVTPVEPSHSLTRLAIDALQFAAAWPVADRWSLTQKLYEYNRRPLTPRLRARFPDRAAIARMLGLLGAGPTREALDTYWKQHEPGEAWTVFDVRRAGAARGARLCKLYLGIAFEELPQRLPAIAEALGESEALQFKIGAGLGGMLRPDKLVAYFPSKETLLRASRRLLPAIAGATVHGVPFSAGIDAQGLLSWGSDPLPESPGEGLSWRQWICRKSAEALVRARGEVNASLPAWRFALERLRLDGIDTATFMPTASWSGEL
jgi:hypothetical protein